jgi:hypothetical protein
MALATITPQTASVEILLATVSYKNYFSSARVRSNLPQLDATVFGNEATGDFIAGIERLTIDFGGVLKKGGCAAGRSSRSPASRALRSSSSMTAWRIRSPAR